MKDIVDKYGFGVQFNDYPEYNFNVKSTKEKTDEKVDVQFNSTKDYGQIEGLTKVAKFFIDEEKKTE